MKHHRLMTLLPALPEKPEAPPAPLETVLAYVEDALEGKDWTAADALLQVLDCQNVESVLLGRERFDERAPRTRAQIEGKLELPEYMDAFISTWRAGAQAGGYPMRGLWRGYYQNLLEVARETRSSFLRDWATWEIALRNALVDKRSETMGLTADEHLADKPHDEPNHENLLQRLRDAPDPLARQRRLDEERLSVIEALRGTDPFSLDAVLAYLASSLVLEGWRLQEEPDLRALMDEMG